MSNFTNNNQNQSADGSRREARGARPTGGEVPFSVTGDFRDRDQVVPVEGVVDVSGVGPVGAVPDAGLEDSRSLVQPLDGEDLQVWQEEIESSVYEYVMNMDLDALAPGKSTEGGDETGCSGDGATGKSRQGRCDNRSYAWMIMITYLNQDEIRRTQAEGIGVVRAHKDALARVVDLMGRYDAGVWQVESGEDTGLVHIQLFLQNRNQIRFSTLRNLLGNAHIESMYSKPRNCVDYVTKTESRIAGPFCWGEIKLKENQGARNDLEKYYNLIRSGWSPNDVVRKYPHAARYINALHIFVEIREQDDMTSFVDRDVYYLYGAPGVGKTRLMYELYSPREMFRVTDYDHPFDNYQGQRVLVLDEFDSNRMRIDTALSILDKYPAELNARYRNKHAKYQEVWVISNKPIQSQYSWLGNSSDGRWQAFRRRFTSVFKMVQGGKLIDVSKQHGSSDKANPNMPVLTTEDIKRLIGKQDGTADQTGRSGEKRDKD